MFLRSTEVATFHRARHNLDLDHVNPPSKFETTPKKPGRKKRGLLRYVQLLTVPANALNGEGRGYSLR